MARMASPTSVPQRMKRTPTWCSPCSTSSCAIRRKSASCVTTQTGDDAHVDTLVRVEAQRQVPDLSTLGGARIAVAQRSDERAILVPFASDLVLMAVVIGQRCMHGGEAEVRMRFDDLVRRHALVLVFGRNLTDLDVRSGNHWEGA